MHKNKEIARKVARLIVRKIPKDKNTLMSTGELISFLAKLYIKSRDFRNFFVSPFIPKDRKVSFLQNLIEKFNAPKEVVEVLEYLVDINAFALLPEVKRLYDHEVEKIMRMSKGFLYLAREVDEDEVNRIVDTVQKALGRELDIDVGYDDSLIGGFVLKTSGFVIDASVKRQLERLIIHGG
ncbi:MAG: ATP synthase F1 subunit delta [Aquificae bacterium]|nr:ATP synthase F1 subunit delta [Aquificota bacterium]